MAASVTQPTVRVTERATRRLPDLRTRDAIQGYLRGVAQLLGVKEDDDAVAAELDQRDCLAHLRNSFHIPSLGQLLNEAEKDPGE